MRFASAVLLCIALAGCFGGNDPGPAPPQPPDDPPPNPPSDDPEMPADPPVRQPTRPDPGLGYVPLLTAFDFVDCVGSESVAYAPVDELQPLVPDGYTVTSVQPPVPVPVPVGAVQLVMLRCAAFETTVGVFDDAALGHVAIRVEDPGHEVSGDEHWYRLRMLAEPGLMTNLWQAVPYDVHSGGFNQSVTGEVPAGLVHLGQWTTSFGDYSTDLASTAQVQADSIRIVHYTQVPTGRVEWTGTFNTTTTVAGTGPVTVAGDDPTLAVWGGVHQQTSRVLVDVDLAKNDLWIKSAI